MYDPFIWGKFFTEIHQTNSKKDSVLWNAKKRLMIVYSKTEVSKSWYVFGVFYVQYFIFSCGEVPGRANVV